MNNITFALGTHTGLVRELNEDSYLAAPEVGLWAIADGMGGHEAGEVASRIAVQEILHGVKSGMSLSKAVDSAHYAIQQAAAQGEGGRNMGSTIVAVQFHDCDYEIVWVGDSRAYLWNGNLTQLTKDHSYVQSLLDAGLIDKDQIPGHPYRNVISQALGTGGPDDEDIEPELVSGRLGPSETLLLCSDGLTGAVADREIAAILAESEDNQIKVNRLIQAALTAGGRDNITVVVISLDAPAG
ncbi:PP2C family protein-serine/threonine phosphatase [Methylosarcina fibrata]|uniref:PP2C family protein-serine/threonine phosphatase n=1 Tax=Methylosarcina fibrata TaxID=105972 RepID=UPI00037A9596|nr:protein phosphatase 2C domain-containing protein [Methylosarcina fibrata]